MGLLNPIALLFSALIGVLVLLYLWERVRRRVDVPSLLLWQSVPEDPVQLRRFQPDWLFLLQLALLAALIVGLARPYLSGTPVPGTGAQRHVLVMDTSASMQAEEGGKTRFQQAQERAEALVRRFGTDDEAMLISAAAHPEIVLNFTRNRAALIASIQALAAVDTGTNIATAMALARRARERDPDRTEVVLFTDLPLSALDPKDRATVRRFAFGTASDNLAISALHIFQGPFEEPARARAYVLIRNFSYGERHGVLTVALGAQVVTRTGFTIPGRGARTFLVKKFSHPGLVTASIDVGDALAADNRAYGWIHDARKLRLLLVSPASSLIDDLRVLARAVPGMRLERVGREEYDPAAASRFDIVIFNRYAPSPPATSALYIYPPAGTALFPVVGDSTQVEIVDWNDRHPSLRGIQPLPPYPLQKARIIQPPPRSEPLLWSRSGGREFPLAFTTAIDGRRIACIAFDLEAEHLLSNDNVNLVVFFLNLLDWLAPPDMMTPAVVSTGDVVNVDDLRADLPARIVDPGGHTVSRPAGAQRIETTHAGVYTVSTDGTSRQVIANFFDPIESDIGRASEGSTGAPALTAASKPLRVRHELGWWLYAIAAALMLAEWAAWRRFA